VGDIKVDIVIPVYKFPWDLGNSFVEIVLHSMPTSQYITSQYIIQNK